MTRTITQVPIDPDGGRAGGRGEGGEGQGRREGGRGAAGWGEWWQIAAGSRAAAGSRSFPVLTPHVWGEARGEGREGRSERRMEGGGGGKER
jgi:hypothetical protein